MKTRIRIDRARNTLDMTVTQLSAHLEVPVDVMSASLDSRFSGGRLLCLWDMLMLYMMKTCHMIRHVIG